jgi:TfoX/Sxy family transcriptional regulator of competence genes
MTWSKNSPGTVARIEEALKGIPVRKRQMFGCPCYFADDAMCCGVHDDHIFLRLAEHDRERLLADWPEVRRFEPLPGRVMREYLVLPPALPESGSTLREWLARSFAYASSLPPKPKRPGIRNRGCSS